MKITDIRSPISRLPTFGGLKPALLCIFCAGCLVVFPALPAAAATMCYVKGDTSQNIVSHPLGSNRNPYGSLAVVEADTDCETIIVLYSSVALDGGITLTDSQKLEGRMGPGNALPVISNTTAANNDGHGVQLAANNTIAKLHIRDSYNSAVVGGNVGKFKIKDSLITGFGQSEALVTNGFGDVVSPHGLFLTSTNDVNIEMTKTEISEAKGSAVIIVALAGHADIAIDNLTVRNLGIVDGAYAAAGVAVIGAGASSVDAVVRQSSVSNIGGGDSNSDGMVFLAVQSSTMTVVIDEYSYLNPDGDGGPSAMGLEIGNFHGSGASFEATVKNSTFHGGSSLGMQIIDLGSGGGSNFLSVHIHNNEFYDSAFSGIELDFGQGAAFGTNILTIEDNLIVNAGNNGIEVFSIREQQNVLNVLLQRNTIINSAHAGLAFYQVLGAGAATLNLDAGLGGLGSEGNNKIINSQGADIYVEAFDCCGLPPTPPFTVEAANNWWGSASGPATVIEFGGATVDVTPFLTEEPKDKKHKD